jgi:hypothetical protein
MSSVADFYNIATAPHEPAVATEPDDEPMVAATRSAA